MRRHWFGRLGLFVLAGLALPSGAARADVVDTPTSGTIYEDGLMGSAAKMLRDHPDELTEDQRKTFEKARDMVNALKGLRPPPERTCPKIAVHYVNGDHPVRDFARHAAANNSCAINLYFGHTEGGEDATVSDAMKPLNDAPAAAKAAQQGRSGVWGCYSGKYNGALGGGRKVSASGGATTQCRGDAMYAGATADLPKIASSDVVAMCEACGNAVTVHLYFGELDAMSGGNQNGYGSW